MKYKYSVLGKKESPGIEVTRSAFNHYNRPRVTLGESNIGQSKVSVGAYIDSLELIDQLLAAGEHLQVLRECMSGATYSYDVYDDTISDDKIPTTVSRRMDFDLVDWSQLKADIDNKVEKMKRVGELNKAEGPLDNNPSSAGVLEPNASGSTTSAPSEE